MASRRRQVSAIRIPTADEIAQREADRTQFADIDSRILALENSLRLLWEERSLLKKRLDDYTYPVLTLPNEIVADIFVHFLPVYPLCPPPCGILAPTKLGQICHNWREIALTTPVLWRAISLHLPVNTDGLWENLYLLKSWLELSRSCPLSIRLQGPVDYGGGDSTSHSRNLEPFMEAVVSHSARWEYLKINLPLTLTTRFSEAHAPLLRSSHLGGWWAPEELGWIPSIEAFQLRKLVIDRYRDSFAPLLPWSQLTMLHMRLIWPHQFMDLLHHTVNLVHCKLDILINDQLEPDAALINPRPLTLSHLESLVMLVDDWLDEGVTPTGWFGLTTFPALRRLQVPESLLNPDPIATLLALISRSHCSLQQLFISENHHAPTLNAYRTALPYIPSILFSRKVNIGNRLFTHDSSVVGYETNSEEDEYEDKDKDEDKDEDEDDEDTPFSGLLTLLASGS